MPRSLRPATFFAVLTMLVVPASAISANGSDDKVGDTRPATGQSADHR